MESSGIEWDAEPANRLAMSLKESGKKSGKKTVYVSVYKRKSGLHNICFPIKTFDNDADCEMVIIFFNLCLKFNQTYE